MKFSCFQFFSHPALDDPIDYEVELFVCEAVVLRQVKKEKVFTKKINLNPKLLQPVCKICGNLEFDKAPHICIICDHGEKFFKKM